MSTLEDLRADAIEEMETEDDWNRHEGHEGEYADPEGCWICRERFNEYLRSGETLPDSWFEGRDGYLRERLTVGNPEGDPTRNGAFGG